MRPILGLAFATGIYIFALGMIIPILPFQILSLGGSPFEATLIYSVFSGVSVLTLRFWGLMSDRFGRTPILWLSVSFTALSYLWLAHANALWEVYASRALAGAFAAWLPVSQAFVSDVIKPEKRAPAMGLLGVGFGVGFTIGPAVSGYLASSGNGQSDFWTPFILATAVCVATLIAAIFFIREPQNPLQKTDKPAPSHSIWQDKALLLVLGIYFSVSVLFTGIEGIFAVWGEAQLNWKPHDVGYLLMIAGIGSIIAQSFLIRIATRKFREARTALIGLVGIAASMAALSFAYTNTNVTVAIFGIALFMGLHNPAMQSLISQIAPEEWRGKVLSIAQAASSLARVIGPLWAALVFAEFGGNSVFMVTAALSVALCFVGWWVLKPHFIQPDRQVKAAKNLDA